MGDGSRSVQVEPQIYKYNLFFTFKGGLKANPFNRLKLFEIAPIF